MPTINKDLIDPIIVSYFEGEHLEEVKDTSEELYELFKCNPEKFLACIFAIISLLGREYPPFRILMLRSWDK